MPSTGRRPSTRHAFKLIPLVLHLQLLTEKTGQRTVPSVWVGGKHIGGCDDTHALHSSGKLVPMIEAASKL
jgi:hypothetical protein